MRRASAILTGVGIGILSVSFVAAGIFKLAEPAAFSSSVASLQLVPREWSNLVAMILPVFEIACALGLLCVGWRRSAALCIGALNLIFIAVLAYAAAHGITSACSCFGKWDPLAGNTGAAIARDVVFLAFAAVAFHREGAQSPVPSASAHP